MLASGAAAESLSSLCGSVYCPSFYLLFLMLKIFFLYGLPCDTYNTCMYELHNGSELLFILSLLGADVMVFILIYAGGTEEQ